jgi:hypothetical protein
MRAITCTTARRRLGAFHDEELTIREQIVVSAHLHGCEACSDELAELRLLRAALRDALPGRSAVWRQEEAGFQAGLVNRMRAEQAESLPVRMRAMFDDMHFVYAGVGAVAAALVCLTVTVTMYRFAMMIAQPDSLPAIVHLVPTPEADLRQLPSFDLSSPVPISAHVLMPRALDEAFPINLHDDAVLTLAAVLSREGQMSNIEVVHSMAGKGGGQLADAAIGSVMGAMSRARFEPARVDGLPVAVNMVWLVAQTTVRGGSHPTATPAARPGKKRIATIDAPVADSAAA